MNIVEKIISGEIKSVSTDSRKVQKGSLYIPINGEKFNGNSFIKDAFLNGASYSLVEKKYYEKNYRELEGFNLFVVEDTLVALLEYTREFLEKTNIKVIGVTGSNGKTSTKDFLYSIMKVSNSVGANEGNYNNNIGLPLTVLNSDPNLEYLILEMGMSEFGEIDLLANAARPIVSVITNIGTSHIAQLGSRNNILKAKMEIVNYFGENNILIVNADDPYLSTITSNKYQLIKASVSELDSYDKRIDGFYCMTYKGINININVRGFHQVYNSFMALKVAEILGVSLEDIKQGIESYRGEAMRFTLVRKGDIRVVNDAYNSSYASLKVALETIIAMDANRKIAVIGDVLELGDSSAEEHRKIGRLPQMKELDMLLTIGEFAKEICYYNSNAVHFKDISKLSNYLNKNLRAGDLVLVKASRGMKLERIVELIEEKND